VGELPQRYGFGMSFSTTRYLNVDQGLIEVAAIRASGYSAIDK